VTGVGGHNRRTRKCGSEGGNPGGSHARSREPCPCDVLRPHVPDANLRSGSVSPSVLCRARGRDESGRASRVVPRNHAKVSLPIGAQPAVSYYTVERPVETAGPLTVTSISVSCEEGDQVVSGGYVHTKDNPDLQVSGSYPDGTRTWLVQIQNFSETLLYQVSLFARCARLTP
jgi:hypothetical protein